MVKGQTIRRYRKSDAEQVWTVHELALRASNLEFVEGASADEDLTDIEKHYLEQGGEFLVGLEEDAIVATGGFQLRDETTAEIRRMRVHPDHQRQGYGEELLAELEARAQERGATRLVLNTNEQLTAAQHLYETHGYEEVSRETHPVVEDVLIYYRKEIQST